MTTLLLAEHDGKLLSEQTARTLAAAAKLGAPVHVLVAGAGVASIAEAASRLDGVAKVLVADDAAYAHQLAEPLSALLVSLAPNYDALLAPSTANGKSVMPRVAALLDVMQISDVIAIDGTTFQRPTYAGNAIETVTSSDPKLVVTVRGSAFKPVGEGAASAPVEAVAAAGDPVLSRFIKEELDAAERPELTSARIVVSGGRALGSKEKFEELILPLADKLGAAVGASRAAVDAGYAPNDWQVGQTGKMVAPDLYIAAGISGAIQHVAGISDSRVIVAINKDEEAPIFQLADYGLVGDIFTILPELKDKL
ncbi:electron transfer flavoprotein subunit alpha/FixB family protein [Consotaella salsifontis]|uniref:Electron transfer flavoprotein subunit alpha n=1 Tax=Consotaella salsifontis TaxID=1365950 RepID=A0A1T4RRV0_9HYPH|nr:electron transfer flavoprotein subunit alpha/FixB family protein [Consotaella salsifontis]SKA18694.1 electron transfer flavoprotein alpha subunit apoprotein [Consotaella salsifontis]